MSTTGLKNAKKSWPKNNPGWIDGWGFTAF